MFDWGRLAELFIISGAALILIGPKEIPVVLKSLGRWIRRFQDITRETRSLLADILQEKDIEIYQETLNQHILKTEKEEKGEKNKENPNPCEESSPKGHATRCESSKSSL